MTIKVSIIIAAYEAAQFLPMAIETCTSQTLESFEVIVVDDASPTSLEEVVRSAANGDSRIRFVRLDKNQGPAAARNQALDLAQGEFVAILDADDLMAPDRLELLHSIATEHSADIVADNLHPFEEDPEREQSGTFFDLPNTTDSFAIDIADLIGSGIDRFGQSLGYIKPLLRKSFIDAGGFRYDPELRNSEDYYFLAELLAHGAYMRLTSKALYHYRRHDSSLSHRISSENAYRIADKEADFRQRYATALSAEARSLSRRRERLASDAAQLAIIVDALKRRRLLGAAAALFQNPLSSHRHLQKLFRIGIAKIR